MKKLLIVIVSVFLVGSSVFAVTYNSNPKIFITELVGDAMKTLNDKEISVADKNKAIEEATKSNIGDLIKAEMEEAKPEDE